MKLQNLIMIFIIIIIPIIIIFSYYLGLEAETIRIQTDYDGKLIEATKEAVEAFEINTTEWNSEFSTLANSKRRDLLASINTFSTSLSNKLGIGGNARENILNYVPAIVYIMYDGYYIYSPTYVPQTITDQSGVQYFYYKTATDNKFAITPTKEIKGEVVAGKPMYSKEDIGTRTYNGENVSSSPWTVDIKEAKKTYKHVLKTFVPYSTTYGEYTINYTLDNYIRIYGKDEAKEGYIIKNFGSSIKFDSTGGITVDDENIKEELLLEFVPIKNEAKQSRYSYIYNSNNDKRYYDDKNGKFFTINSQYEKVYLPEVEVGNSLAEYKKILIKTSDTEYMRLYQLLNSQDNTWYYINNNNEYKEYTIQPEIARGYDCSAINYYVETYCFNKWLKNKFNDNEIDQILEDRQNSIINNINNNLKLSIANYSANSKIDYKLPEISDTDWEQALSNISMITFFQGVKTGLKTYNNYSVVTSTQNNEYINDDSLYYICMGDEYYHRYGCNEVKEGIIEAYRNIEFKPQSYSYENNGNTISGYYYKHEPSERECFDCIVNRNNMEQDTDLYLNTYYNSMAREKYIQMSRTKLTNSSSIIIDSELEPDPIPEPIQQLTATISATINGSTNNVDLSNSIAYATKSDLVLISVNVTGGTGNYTYSWDNDSIRKRNVEDASVLTVRVPNEQQALEQQGYVNEGSMQPTDGVWYTCNIKDGDMSTQISFKIQYTG